MRVLITSTTGVGHLHPLVLLARAPRNAGHDERALGADPFENTAAIVETGAGRSGLELEAHALADAARALLVEGEHRVAAARLAADFGVLPSPEHAVRVLEGLRSAAHDGERDGQNRGRGSAS